MKKGVMSLFGIAAVIIIVVLGFFVLKGLPRTQPAALSPNTPANIAANCTTSSASITINDSSTANVTLANINYSVYFVGASSSTTGTILVNNISQSVTSGNSYLINNTLTVYVSNIFQSTQINGSSYIQLNLSVSNCTMAWNSTIKGLFDSGYSIINMEGENAQINDLMTVNDNDEGRILQVTRIDSGTSSNHQATLTDIITNTSYSFSYVFPTNKSNAKAIGGAAYYLAANTGSSNNASWTANITWGAGSAAGNFGTQRTLFPRIKYGTNYNQWLAILLNNPIKNGTIYQLPTNQTQTTYTLGYNLTDNTTSITIENLSYGIYWCWTMGRITNVSINGQTCIFNESHPSLLFLDSANGHHCETVYGQATTNYLNQTISMTINLRGTARFNMNGLNYSITLSSVTNATAATLNISVGTLNISSQVTLNSTWGYNTNSANPISVWVKNISYSNTSNSSVYLVISGYYVCASFTNLTVTNASTTNQTNSTTNTTSNFTMNNTNNTGNYTRNETNYTMNNTNQTNFTVNNTNQTNFTINDTNRTGNFTVNDTNMTNNQTNMTNQTLPRCSDTDGGRVYNITGRVTVTNTKGKSTNYNDKCTIILKRLKEYYCSGTSVASTTVNCKTLGYRKCSAGRCV